MGKHNKDPLLVALAQGQSYTWTVPDGGNLASMRKAIKHGQTLTMSPITDPSEIQVGDMVLVKWHKSDIFHLVGDIKDGRYLIVNSLRKVNGWVAPSDILGRVTKVVDPDPRPGVNEMIRQLDMDYGRILKEFPELEDVYKNILFSVIAHLDFYAGRIGEERWDQMPRSNKWSFEQNLYHLLKEATHVIENEPDPILTLIDQGVECVGKAAEIVRLFEEDES